MAKLQLSEDFIQEVQRLGNNEVALNNLIATVAKNNAAIQEAKEDDMDLLSKKEAYADASAVYRESEKMSKLKIKFIREQLKAIGKPAGEAPASEDDESLDS